MTEPLTANVGQDNKLEEALALLAAGLPPATILAEYEADATWLRPLLEAAAEVQSLQADFRLPSPAASLQRLLAYADDLTSPPSATVAPRSGGWSALLARLSRANLSRLSLSFMTALVLLLVMGGGVVLTAQRSLPGQMLYPLKQTVETLQLELRRDPEAQQLLLQQFNQRRLNETRQLLERGERVRVGFDGQIESLTEIEDRHELIIETLTAQITPNTLITGDLTVGARVAITGITQPPDQVLVLEIIVLEPGPPLPTPTTGPRPTETATISVMAMTPVPPLPTSGTPTATSPVEIELTATPTSTIPVIDLTSTLAAPHSPTPSATLQPTPTTLDQTPTATGSGPTAQASSPTPATITPAATLIPPTAPVIPTASPAPSTATAIPTTTPLPPTATITPPAAPTNSPVPPSATPSASPTTAPTSTPPPTATPIDSSDDELDYQGIIAARPDNTNIGSWVIGGQTFLADANTEIRADHGPLEIEACARVRYMISNNQNIATRIRSEELKDCSDE